MLHNSNINPYISRIISQIIQCLHFIAFELAVSDLETKKTVFVNKYGNTIFFYFSQNSAFSYLVKYPLSSINHWDIQGPPCQGSLAQSPELQIVLLHVSIMHA